MTKLSRRTKVLLLVCGDILAFYAALAIALFLRYQQLAYYELITAHLVPFSLAALIWLLVFYIAGLYDLPRLRNNLEFLKTLAVVLAINTGLTITLFYLLPWLGIAPRRNLFIFILVFACLEAWWRTRFNIRASFREGLNRVLLIGENARIKEMAEALTKNPQMGYEITVWLKRGLADPNVRELPNLIRRHHINIAVIPNETTENEALTKIFYDLLTSGISVFNVPVFYESVFRKVALSELDKSWFLENHLGERKFYDELKRGLEFASALILSLIISPLVLLLALLIRSTSRGPIIYKQTRVGAHGKEFILYKFRSMKKDAEKNGPQWSTAQDNRTTLLGKILRYTHLDELPQIWNILRGELSFVGPRPERPEFVTELEAKIPHYKIRLLVKPGITGWAQINYRYGASVEDAYEKMQYDIYYIKHRALVLDLAIIIKTIKSFFINYS